MTGPIYFETGTHHVLCEIPGLDPVEFPYPKDFQDCWDHHHVRLPCSSRSPSSSSESNWPEIVQGLTTTIHNSKELSDIMAQWNGGTGRHSNWNTRALSAFLNKRADNDSSDNSSMPSLHARSAGRHSPLSFSFLREDEPSPLPMLGDGNEEQDKDGSRDDEDNFPPTQPVESEDEASQADGADTLSEDSDNEEDQFLNKEERDRFFQVVLPKMQALALRLPELVKKPIPFLNQQQDSAVTLRQEQIACLLANAFFNTFPQRNSTHLDHPHRSATTDKKRKAPPASSESEKKKTLGQAPKDPYGNSGDRKPKSGDPFRNTNGQKSLFAYFNKKDPVLNSAATSSQPHTTQSLERQTSEISLTQETASIDSSIEIIAVSEVKVKKVFHEKKTSPQLRLPSINFSTLFSSDDIRDPCSNTNAAKLRCLVHYFDRVTSSMPQGTVTFHRQVLMTPLTMEQDERLGKRPFRYANVRVDCDSPLEDDAPSGALQLDFANKVIGGGVLGRGAVQEEIRLMICPELIVSRLFTKTLQSNEALMMKGAERYSNYNGYASTFEWHSDHQDSTQRDKLGRRKTEICAIDAVHFRSREQRLDQFRDDYVLREISKAIVGFRRSPITASEWGLCRAEEPARDPTVIATGNWGCGAFGGHLELKFLIQLLAASVCGGYAEDDRDTALGRDLVYYTYGLDDLGHEITEFMSHLQACPTAFEPSVLLECIVNYPLKSSKGRNIALREKSLLNYVGTAFGFPSLMTNPSQAFSTCSSSAYSSFDELEDE